MNTQVSRPVLVALVAVVAFAAIWLVALRPKSESGGTKPAASSSPSAPGVTGLTNAIGKAKGAVAQSQGNAAAQAQADASAGGAPKTTPAPSAAAPSGASGGASAPAATSGSTHASGAAGAVKAGGARLSAEAAAVNRALERGQVVALLFFNPRSSDDLAVRHEFSHVSTRGGKVVVVTSPLAGLSSFGEVTKRVQVTETPSVIIFDRRGRPSTIVGFTTHAEIDQRISDALASRR